MDWAIVGGGIHGVHVALRLLVEAGVPRERLCIVDPAERLLTRWRACTDVTGMAYLRSPAVHHVGPEQHPLLRFAGKRRDRSPGLFALPYDRPSLSLFNAHCDHLIRSYGLDQLHVRARVVKCSVEDDLVRLHLSGGARTTARGVVLAIGASEEPHWPAWAPRGDPRVQHVFAPELDGWPPKEAETVAVVGGGISAAQIAIRLAGAGNRVQLVSRHAVREHQFDSNPGWLGPKYMAGFERMRNYALRRATIAEARNRGSLPPDVHRALRLREKSGAIIRHRAEVEEVARSHSGVRVRMSNGRSVDVERVLLATGYTTARPGGRMIDELIRSAHLCSAPCGYPIVDTALRWHPRVHVTGPLAELELGPVARTIAGARRAADRILGGLCETEKALRASAS